MAQNMAYQDPQLLNPAILVESSDNESVRSKEADNTQDLCRKPVKNEMGAIAAQVKERVLGFPMER